MGDGGVGRRTFLAAMTGGTTAAEPGTDAPAHDDGRGGLGGQAGREDDIRKLIARMTVPEKLGQLQQLSWTGATGPGGSQTAEAEEAARKGQLGSVLNIIGARHSNALQRIAVEESRLGIPLVFGLDVIHGFWTTFPIPLAQAASFDPEVARVDAEVSAKEARSNGVHWTFSPMMDVTHEPRWGRIAESCGEDPYLTAAFAAAKTRGYQGDDLAAQDRIAACAKHFVAYGGAEGGRDYNTVDVSESRLRNMYLPPFKAALDAGCATVMASFNTLSGIPAHANSHTLTGILKEEWGFEGLVVSDWNGVGELLPHGFAADGADAGRVALDAGVDMEMVSTHLADHGAELLASGRIEEDRLDDAVARVLRVKYALGLFEQPYAREESAIEVPTPAARKAARVVAARSMVLLKNEGGLLPVAPGTSVAVVGPFADSRDLHGTWAGPGWEKFPPVSVLAGIKEAAGPGAKVTYGVGATERADLVVVVVGEGAALSGEAAARSDLDLPDGQQDLVAAVAATGKPFVVVLLNGRPLTVGDWIESAPAVLEAWHPGTEGGHAIADVLYGKVNPGGKLPASFPRGVGQIPVHYNHENTGRPFDPRTPDNTFITGYLDIERTPQFPFGYGLSYTTFEAGTPTASVSRVAAADLRRGETFTVEVEVRNTGEREGDEVVQLYLHDPVATMVQPVRRLRGFERVTLAAGERTVVRFTLGAADIGFWTNATDGQFVVEPGELEIYAGTSSEARERCGVVVE
ncbi:glycoside hydrolase family 3 N-terminal domain-containing protein [Streptomyces sp. NPDC091272]|uniref:glycoside hydrolase family 3 N-terminal domain-containing protein n=1 Tax=Streptomyces sp. NPDC091272 TaxID=3365981 RepID=UPI003812BA05